MIYMSLINVVSYIIKRRLAGDYKFLKSIEMLYLRNMSPSDVSRELGIPKNNIRSNMQSLLNILNNHIKTAAVVRYLLPIVNDIDPIIVDVGPSLFRCKICNKEYRVGVRSMQPRLNHIESYHRGLVEDYTKIALKRLKHILTGLFRS
jgi:hypothetical protein